MNFSTASKVLETIRAGDTAEWARGENRKKINVSANCAPPLDDDLAKKMGIKVNVNFGEMMTLLAQARRQYRAAFFGTGRFFTVKIPKAPTEYQSEWEWFITDWINTCMNESLSYFEEQESKWAAVVSHGPGPTIYYGPDNWESEYLAIEDLRISTDTKLSFKNLDWFSARKMWTPLELVNAVFPVKPTPQSKKWNKKQMAEILKNYKPINFEYPENSYDWETSPEKLAELVRQNGGYYDSDALPKIPLWHFYFKDETMPKVGWYMVVVPETGAIRGTPPQDFLWQSDEPVAEKREHILQCQFGDLSNKSPFLYKSVRSLGFALLEPCFYDNLTICRAVQHLHDNFNIWIRVNDPPDKARAQIQEFGNMSVIRSGVTVVPQQERHQIDHNMLETVMAKTKQLQQEVSQSYTQQTDTGTRKEQTAFETSVKVQQVNAMMSGLLVKAFKYATSEYKEICRRFCRQDSEDKDVKKFQQDCEEAGIPRRWLDSRLWKVEPVTPLGMGNPTVGMAAAQQLLQILPLLDPTAQQEAKHEIVLTYTQDPRKAARWAPLGKGRGITDAQRDSQLMFGSLMQGVPMEPREGLSVIDQIEGMLPLLEGKIKMIAQRNNMATPEEVVGLYNVMNYLAGSPPKVPFLGLIPRLAQNPNEKQRVKQYMDQMMQLGNELKGLAQRGAEAAQNQNGNGQNQEEMAKIQAMMMTTAAKIKGKQATDQQRMAMAERKFKAEERRKSQEFVKGQRREDANAFAEIQRQGAKAKVQNRLKSTQE